VSGHQIQSEGVIEDVRAALEESGLDARHLVLEITESVLMQHTASTIDKLAQLRADGIRLAIDDFGTGYSSLSYLDRFPVDVLKIDRSFVDGFGGGREGPVLVRAIIELGQALRLEVIAEGIERADQVDPLNALGCRYGQGYLFARPMDAAALGDLLGQAPQTGAETLVALADRPRSKRTGQTQRSGEGRAATGRRSTDRRAG